MISDKTAGAEGFAFAPSPQIFQCRARFQLSDALLKLVDAVEKRRKGLRDASGNALDQFGIVRARGSSSRGRINRHANFITVCAPRRRRRIQLLLREGTV